VTTAAAISLVVTASIRLLKPHNRNVHFLLLCKSPIFVLKFLSPKKAARQTPERDATL
jgi:hypothetical protein